VSSPRRRSPWFKAIVFALAVCFFVLFVALGTWQVKRRAWKLDLIARVEQRVHAPALPAPGPAQWPNVTAAADEYRHVTATGTFLDSSQTLVQAVTDLGAGYWVLTPLRQVDGSVVLINRGFVPADDRGRVRPGASLGTRVVDGSTAAAVSTGGDGRPAVATSTVTGLLRMTEPRGAFLRHNNPAANQWYSRDVQAIAAARGLSQVAPYFIDAEANRTDGNIAPPASPPMGAEASAHNGNAPIAADTPVHDGSAPIAAGPGSAGTGDTVAPTPGLTVIHFHNSHLVYAITWYTLALMTAIAIPLGMRKQ
jgi:surfeit locus 1 family protein